MQFRTIALALVSAATISSAAHAAVTVHTSPFITSPGATNDFERDPNLLTAENTAYSQGGVTIRSVAIDGGTLIYNNLGATGLRDWYDPGNAGYEDITLASGGAFDSIQFSAFSGWSGDDNSNTGTLYYDLLFHGVSVGSGAAGGLGFLTPSTYGFSGATFDEVLIQAQQGAGSGGLNVHRSDALGLDNIAIGGISGAVPEPASWALVILGLGGAGTALRRRRAMVVA